MRTKLFITLTAICCTFMVEAQKPFAEMGLDNEAELLTLSNGRYAEHFTYDSLRQIGSVMFNTKTNKVQYFIPEDDIEKQKVIARSKEASRFLSIDPMAGRYPQLSPYNFVANSPTIFTDADGKVITFTNANGEVDALAQSFYDLYYVTASPEQQAKLDILQSSDVVYNVTFEAFSGALEGYGGASTYNWEKSQYEAKINTSFEANIMFGSLADELEGAYQYETDKMAAFSLHRQSGWLYYDANDELKTKEAAFEAREAFGILADAFGAVYGVDIPIGVVSPEYQQLNDLYNNFKSGVLTEDEYLSGYHSWLGNTDIGKSYSSDFENTGGNPFPTLKLSDTQPSKEASLSKMGAGQKIRYRQKDAKGKTQTITLETPD